MRAVNLNWCSYLVTNGTAKYKVIDVPENDQYNLTKESDCDPKVMNAFVEFLRPWQTRTHCCGHIAAHDVSWARKRAGHKMNVVFPCCAN